MVERQQEVVRGTIEIDATRRPNQPLDDAAVPSVAKLSDEESALAQLAREHSELLQGLGAVRISVKDAERCLTDAAERLENRDTGPRAQQAARRALARLEGMLEAFAQTAKEAAPTRQADQRPVPAAQSNQPPQRRPTFALLEVKMLRMLQVDLNERTRQFKAKMEDLSESTSADERADLRRDALQLQAEQGQLSELVEQMLIRDNDVDER
jgi:hypothetical protein